MSDSDQKRLLGDKNVPRTFITRSAGTNAPIHASFQSLVPPAMHVMVVVASSYMLFWAYKACEVSAESHPSFAVYQHKLSAGWLPGTFMDNSDAQYASFRNNIPALVVVMLVHVVLSACLGFYTHSAASIAPSTYKRILFSLAFSIVFLSALYGMSMIKIGMICGLHFWIVKMMVTSHRRIPASAVILFSWTYGILMLFANSVYSGYSFKSLHSSLAWMDQFRGIGMRWHISFNFAMLRMVSFATDYAWRSNESPRQFERHKISCDICASGDYCPRGRIESPLPESTYNITNYFAYLLYAPLYMAGPIICFNDFISQMHKPPRYITSKTVMFAAIRWIGLVILMEFMIHVMHVVAIKDTHAWKGFSSLQIFAIGYYNLKLVWLKLLIIWRFFRLWATSDSIDTVDNMSRCMSNHYSAAGFWRAWHRSFNRWIIRYLYVPLGGKKRYLLNVLVTFTFVALWHDIELKLIMWGWLIALFLIPELISTRLFCTEKMRQQLGPWYIHLCALGAVGNIFMMMIANIIGFVIGLDSLRDLGNQLSSDKFQNIVVNIGLGVVPGFFALSHVMFYVRALERSKGRRAND